MMWFLLLLTAHVELVIIQVQGEDKLILKGGPNPCEGHIEIYHDGTPGYVGDENWNDNTGKVVCRSAHCGEHKSSTLKPAITAINKVALNNLMCTGQETELWNCEHEGWYVRDYIKGHLMNIECSDNITLSLDGPDCAGAVRYTNGKTSGYFCADGWNKNNYEADLLCRSLGCGTAKDIPEKPWMVWKDFQNSNKMLMKCPGSDKVDHLWQCAAKATRCDNPASVICSDYKRLQLKGKASNVCSGQLQIEANGKWTPAQNIATSPEKLCQEMHCGSNGTLKGKRLDCTDNVKVVLMDNNKPSRCYGTVNIEVNGKRSPVCGVLWKGKEAEVVCRELNCGTVLSTADRQRPRSSGIMDNVECLGSESSLWHCRAQHAKDDKSLFRCSNAYVVCSESVEVRLVDGPGRCAGRVEIQQEGKWLRVVNETGWQKSDSDSVCSQMKCGKKARSTEARQFSPGSGDFWQTCKTKDKRISQCASPSVRPDDRKEALGITCEDHKMLFLKGEGNRSCSGQVQVAHGSKTYLLSGSNETWNQEYADKVCQQTHCGLTASSHSSIPSGDMMKDVWGESYSCSSKDNISLFECNKTQLPTDHNHTIATVECKGQFTVKLTKECWGSVQVYDMNVSCEVGDEECRGVCDDTWTPEKYSMLCQNLGCGDRALTAINPPGERDNIQYISVHAPESKANLTQCKFIRNKNNKRCKPAYTVCSGSVESRIAATRDKCTGNVEVNYEDKWLPVCKEALKDNKTQNTICAEHDCVTAHAVIPYFGSKSSGPVISEIMCSEGTKSLKACNITLKSSCSGGLGGLQCSDWRKMELTASNKACSGAVIVHSQRGKSRVSSEGWTKTEVDILCQNLECGSDGSKGSMESDISLTTNFKCAGGKEPKTIWDCEKQTENQTAQQLSITCQGEPTVNLSNHCGGELTMNNIEVCGNVKSWTEYNSKLVCQEKKGCGNYIAASFSGPPKPTKEYFHFSCEETHYQLGQCKRFKGTCDQNLVSVYCVGNVQFRTAKECGGQIEVNYGEKWDKVCQTDSLTKALKDQLCEAVKCNRSIVEPSKNNNNNKKRETLPTTLSCSKDTQDIRYCVSKTPCDGVPAEIYCEGYKIEKPVPPVENKSPLVPIILGVGFLLVLLILIVIFTRICIVKKAKNAFSVSRKLSRKEVEFESGDYDEVTEKANEMEDFSRDRFLSESEVLRENDVPSTSSFPYDDIEEAQLLTSQAAAAAGASGDNFTHDSAPDEDGVSYEVEDPQENYDDIDAPEITQTEAEVHASPQTMPESEFKPELVEGDDDYLVPGQEE